MPPKKNNNKNNNNNNAVDFANVNVLDDDNVSHPFPIEERPETNLGIIPIDDVSEAPRIFGSAVWRRNGFVTPLVLLPYNSACIRTVSIPDGCAAVVTRFGKSLGLYKSGFYCLPDFYKVAYLVNTQYVPYHFHIKQCPTKDNVPIKIHVDLLFRIVDPLTFVFDIGPEKLEELLRASQAESVRSLVRTINVAEAYDLRGSESLDVVKSLNDRLKPYGVEVSFITIANVTLPARIAVAMQSETAVFSQITQQRKKQEFELKVLNDDNFTLRIKQDRENERGKLNKESELQRVKVTQDINTITAEYDKILSLIEADQDAAVSKVQALGNMAINQLVGEKDFQVRITKANGGLEASKHRMEAEKYSRSAISEAKYIVAENDAKGAIALGAAEADAAKKMKYKRQFDLAMEYVTLFNNLAQNADVMISADDASQNQFGSFIAAQQMLGMASKK